MSRPKQYDREEVLGKAMEWFWDHGYHATGMADLELAMGINKFSIYAEFESKYGLLLQTLDLYARTLQRQAMSRLDPAAPEASIRWIFGFAANLKESIGHNGCFLLTIAQEWNQEDPEIVKRVDRLYQELERALARCLAALEPGSCPLSGDTKAGAALLRTLLEGILSRSRHGTAVRGVGVDSLLDVLFAPAGSAHAKRIKKAPRVASSRKAVA